MLQTDHALRSGKIKHASCYCNGSSKGLSKMNYWGILVIFFQVRCPACHIIKSVKALKECY